MLFSSRSTLGGPPLGYHSQPSRGVGDPAARNVSFVLVDRSEAIRFSSAAEPRSSPPASTKCSALVGTVRRECLDRLLIFGRRDLEQVLTEYSAHYNHDRPTAPEPAGAPELGTATGSNGGSRPRAPRTNSRPWRPHSRVPARRLDARRRYRLPRPTIAAARSQPPIEP